MELTCSQDPNCKKRGFRFSEIRHTHFLTPLIEFHAKKQTLFKHDFGKSLINLFQDFFLKKKMAFLEIKYSLIQK